MRLHDTPNILHITYTNGNITLLDVAPPAGVSFGTFEREPDGLYYYWPSEDCGCFAPHVLMDIASILSSANRAWYDEIDRYFEKEKQ